MQINSNQRLQGDDFSLRLLERADADSIVAASQSDIPDWTYIPRDLNLESARSWISKGFEAISTGRAVRFALIQDDQFAGTVGGQHPYDYDRGILETFYFVLPAFRRRGLATRGLKLFDQWAQEVTPALRRLQLHVIVGNQGSGRVAERAGYEYEGIAVHQIAPVNGHGPRDAEVYGKRIAFEGDSDFGAVLA